MIYHIITGDLAAIPLIEAVSLEPNFKNEVIVIKDVFSVGPLLKKDGQKFSDLRSSFWQRVIINEKNPVIVDDLERLLKIANELSKNENIKIWIWMAPIPADICTYMWSLQYLHKYATRLFVVNVAGLPFLDDDSKIFYPKSIAEILPKELKKAMRLARLLSKPELETDCEQWDILTKENSIVRIHEGGKKIVSKPESYYDSQLMSFCTYQFQKATKIIGQAIAKFAIPVGDLFLGWRLRVLHEAGKIIILGELTGKLKDLEIKLPGEELQLELGI